VIFDKIRENNDITLILVLSKAVKFFRKKLLRLKLSNSGDFLKLLISNYIRKIISGWINYSSMVISQKIDEKKMEYRGSKSDLNKSVKEQRVDGSWFLNKIAVPNRNLRFTLMGLERGYLVKIPSKQFNISFFLH